MSEWKTYKIGNICDKVCSGGTPKSTESTYYGGNIPWLNTKEINFNQIYATERCITQSGLNNSSAKWIEPDSIIVAMYGATAAKVAINKIPLTTNQACCNLTINKTIADYRYVFYYLCNNYTLLASLANGGAQQNLNAQQIKDFEILLPPLAEQKKIAAILGALDDKIELNRRINANLEQQAQTFFKQWFVDADTSSWKSKHLGDFFKVITGKKDANFSTENGKYPFFTCSQDILKAPEYSFDGHAILLAGNGDFNVKRYIGKFEAYQRTYVLMPFNKKYHTYLYLLIKSNLQNITGGSRGSVIKFITKGNIENFEFLFPTIYFEDKLLILNNMYRVIDRNNSESTYLSQLRNTLLPKLISRGEETKL